MKTEIYKNRFRRQTFLSSTLEHTPPHPTAPPRISKPYRPRFSIVAKCRSRYSKIASPKEGVVFQTSAVYLFIFRQELGGVEDPKTEGSRCLGVCWYLDYRVLFIEEALVIEYDIFERREQNACWVF